MFSLFCNNVHHDLSDLCFIATGLLFDLGEASRVNIQRLNVDQDFVIVDLVHVVINLVSGLR